MSRLGKVVQEEWERSSSMRSEVRCAADVVMPNHFHAVVGILSEETIHVDVAFQREPASLASLVAGFKAAVTSRAKAVGMPIPVWQRGYHEQKLRSDEAKDAAIEYVLTNPSKWSHDSYR